MRAVGELRDPVGIALSALTGATILGIQEGPALAALGAGAVLAFRVTAGIAAGRWTRPMETPLQAPVPAPAQPAASGKMVRSLSPKEAEVAELVAEGLTNREIADRLVLSERTIDNHVLHIMNKLNVHSRTQIGVWVVERRMRANPTKPPTS